MIMKPSPACEDPNCLLRQEEARRLPRKVPKTPSVPEVSPVHEDNDWGKEINIYLYKIFIKLTI